MFLQTGLPLTKNNLSLTRFANDVGEAADSQASKLLARKQKQKNKQTVKTNKLKSKHIQTGIQTGSEINKETNREEKLEHVSAFR